MISASEMSDEDKEELFVFLVTDLGHELAQEEANLSFVREIPQKIRAKMRELAALDHSKFTDRFVAEQKKVVHNWIKDANSLMRGVPSMEILMKTAFQDESNPITPRAHADVRAERQARKAVRESRTFGIDHSEHPDKEVAEVSISRGGLEGPATSSCPFNEVDDKPSIAVSAEERKEVCIESLNDDLDDVAQCSRQIDQRVKELIRRRSDAEKRLSSLLSTEENKTLTALVQLCDRADKKGTQACLALACLWYGTAEQLKEPEIPGFDAATCFDPGNWLPAKASKDAQQILDLGFEGYDDINLLVELAGNFHSAWSDSRLNAIKLIREILSLDSTQAPPTMRTYVMDTVLQTREWLLKDAERKSIVEAEEKAAARPPMLSVLLQTLRCAALPVQEAKEAMEKFKDSLLLGPPRQKMKEVADSAANGNDYAALFIKDHLLTHESVGVRQLAVLGISRLIPRAVDTYGTEVTKVLLNDQEADAVRSAAYDGLVDLLSYGYCNDESFVNALSEVAVSMISKMYIKEDIPKKIKEKEAKFRQLLANAKRNKPGLLSTTKSDLSWKFESMPRVHKDLAGHSVKILRGHMRDAAEPKKLQKNKTSEHQYEDDRNEAWRHEAEGNYDMYDDKEEL